MPGRRLATAPSGFLGIETLEVKTTRVPGWLTRQGVVQQAEECAMEFIGTSSAQSC